MHHTIPEGHPLLKWRRSRTILHLPMTTRTLTSLLLAAALGFHATRLAAAEPDTLPTVTVTDTDSDTILSPDTLVGPYNQPEWTEHRRFSATRVYIQQEPGEIGVEQWWRARSYDNAGPSHRFMEEVEVGLPYRMQLDLYYNWVNEAHISRFDEFSVELRYAFADWGVIPFNPTLYFEYAFVNGTYGGDTAETKILFGDTLGKNWQWGLNLIFESEVSHELSKEFAVSYGLSRSFSPSFSAGVEMQWVDVTTSSTRAHPEIQFEVGPSIQWRISKNTHLDLVCLFGTTNQGPRTESFLVFGWDFGGGTGQPKAPDRYAPVSGTRL